MAANDTAATMGQLNEDQEAFVSWFVSWWRHRGHELISASEESGDAVDRRRDDSPDAPDIKIWRSVPGRDE
jgi:hypothetical protein